MELYTLANPIMIVGFQMLITKLSKTWTPIKSIMFGVGVTTVGMAMNVLPPLLSNDVKHMVNIAGLAVPFAGIFLIVSIASMATGEMMASPRIYEYLGAIAPKGQEGLFMGYANLPIALASMIGGPIGGAMFVKYISGPAAAGQTPDYIRMWVIIAGIGIVSLVGLAVYDSWLRKSKSAEA
jgi:dipeptide/tripeptide permease